MRLRNRIGLILVLRTLIVFGLVMLIVIVTDTHKMVPLYRLPDPEKVSLIATAFEHTPPDTHGDLAHAFSDALLDVRVTDKLPAIMPGAATPETVASYRQALGGRPFRIEVFGDRAPVSFGKHPLFSPDAVRISVALPDDHAVSVEQMVNPSITKILDHRLLFLLAVLFVDIVVILWLAAQTTRPVERLAQAVREDRLDALQRGGPREIVELGESFRLLRGQLRELLHERTRMLAAIAHDYRTYLTRLQLRSEFIDDPEQRALAVTDLEEMQALLSDTLTFARESAGTEADDMTIDIGIELAAVSDDRQARGQQVVIDRLAAPVLARVSHLSFQRMMANLLDNAMRYGGGSATVLVRTVSGEVRIMVEDEGPGVPDDALARLIQPFERLEESRARQTGGVGLGLSIVQALAQRYCGTLRLENREATGFRAILTLRVA